MSGVDERVETLGEEAFNADVRVIRDVLNAADDPNRRRALAALARLADNMAAVIRSTPNSQEQT